jgi:hypothetical protein
MNTGNVALFTETCHAESGCKATSLHNCVVISQPHTANVDEVIEFARTHRAVCDGSCKSNEDCRRHLEDGGHGSRQSIFIRLVGCDPQFQVSAESLRTVLKPYAQF